MSDERITIETVNSYQSTFQTKQGRLVFADILSELGFFNGAIETEEDRIRLNAAHAFLAKCGIWHQANAAAIAEKLLNLPAHAQEGPKEPEKDYLQ